MRRLGLLALASLGLIVVSAGCALRATTDFGPQSPDTRNSVSVGPEGLPGGVTGESGPAGESLGLRGGGRLDEPGNADASGR